jgi:hypothetical protein
VLALVELLGRLVAAAVLGSRKEEEEVDADVAERGAGWVEAEAGEVEALEGAVEAEVDEGGLGV